MGNILQNTPNKKNGRYLTEYPRLKKWQISCRILPAKKISYKIPPLTKWGISYRIPPLEKAKKNGRYHAENPCSTNGRYLAQYPRLKKWEKSCRIPTVEKWEISCRILPLKKWEKSLIQNLKQNTSSSKKGRYLAEYSC